MHLFGLHVASTIKSIYDALIRAIKSIYDLIKGISNVFFYDFVGFIYALKPRFRAAAGLSLWRNDLINMKNDLPRGEVCRG